MAQKTSVLRGYKMLFAALVGYDCFWKETMRASAGPISFPGQILI